MSGSYFSSQGDSYAHLLHDTAPALVLEKLQTAYTASYIIEKNIDNI